jgi:hypothetical protein
MRGIGTHLTAAATSDRTLAENPMPPANKANIIPNNIFRSAMVSDIGSTAIHPRNVAAYTFLYMLFVFICIIEI